jgi:hypothetical protein
VRDFSETLFLVAASSNYPSRSCGVGVFCACTSEGGGAGGRIRCRTDSPSDVACSVESCQKYEPYGSLYRDTVSRFWVYKSDQGTSALKREDNVKIQAHEGLKGGPRF